MSSKGIWLTMLMRGVQLNSLTASNAGTTAPISYTQCYISGGGTLQCLSRRENSRINPEVGNELTNTPPLVYNRVAKPSFSCGLAYVVPRFFAFLKLLIIISKIISIFV